MIRERIANWLTGGEYERNKGAQLSLTLMLQRQPALPSRLESDMRMNDMIAKTQCDLHNAKYTIKAIHEATKDIKHGTAQKVARMCKEALK